jgi:hypothetical protein
MEVHHHHHESYEHKKWHHYFWEFFMLFLAVTLGFFVENQREHLVEHQREKKYMQNLLQDLVRDTDHINRQLVFQQRAVKYADSLVYIMKSPELNKYLSDAYFYARILAIVNPLLFSNATVTQLKSSGSLRLIRKESVADSIVQYDVWTQRIKAVDENIQNLIGDFRSTAGLIFDASVFSNMSNNLLIRNNGSGAFVSRPKQLLPLIDDDKKTINQLCVYAHFLAALYQSHFNNLISQQKRAINLIQLLKKEYHL